MGNDVIELIRLLPTSEMQDRYTKKFQDLASYKGGDKTSKTINLLRQMVAEGESYRPPENTSPTPVDPTPTPVVTPKPVTVTPVQTISPYQGGDSGNRQRNQADFKGSSESTQAAEQTNRGDSVASGERAASIVVTPVSTAEQAANVTQEANATSQNAVEVRTQDQSTASLQQTVSNVGGSVSVSPVVTLAMNDTYEIGVTSQDNDPVTRNWTMNDQAFWPIVLCAAVGVLAYAVIRRRYDADDE